MQAAVLGRVSFDFVKEGNWFDLDYENVKLVRMGEQVRWTRLVEGGADFHGRREDK